MKKLPAFIFSACASLLITLLLSPGVASAYSAYGAGTSDNPYRVATCVQLQEMSNNLAGHYKLVSNIDCTGVAFTSVGTLSPSAPFTGSLNGDNHTISNLNVTSQGLFGYTSGASISNTTIQSGSVTGNGNQGSFIGYSVNSALSNVHSSMTIAIADPSSAAYLGGLVGGSTGVTTIDGSSYSGTMAGGAYVGGLVGYMGNISTPTADVLSNSFFDGTLNQNGVFAGGAVGILYSGTVSNVYSAGTINITGSSNYVGGLIGLSYRGASNNNFSATYMSGNATYVGAMYGSFYVTTNSYNSTRSNNHFDQYRANGNNAYSRNCASVEEGSGNCTAANSSNATPSYFKNNSTNAPFNHVSWDFTDKWRTTSSYPTLRSITSFVDPTVPNSGDANGDGTADSYQARVASVANASSVWSTVELPSNTGCIVASPQAVDANSLKVDSGMIQQLGTMTAFDAYCPTAGMTVPVTVIYDKLYDTSKSILRHYNPTTSTYNTVPGAAFSTRTVGGQEKTIVTYSITDGGIFDTDGVSDGIIKDPVGFSIAPGAPTTGSGSPYQSPASYLLGLVSLSSIIFGLAVLFSRQRMKQSA